MDDIELTFLCDECQSSEDMAHKLADFMRQATKTMDIAIYSFHLCPEPQAIIEEALRERANAGVAIRIAYDAGSQESQMDAPGHNMCDAGTAPFIHSLGYTSKSIEGYRALMHNKYVVLDAGTPDAQVWTGSTNWTDDSWTLQENNILTLRSEGLAAYYAHDFEELWVDANIATSGIMDSGEATLHYGGEPAFVLVNFSPGEGEWIDESIANQIERTQERLTIASVVITSSRIIHALESLMERGVTIEGVYDWTQMEGVKYQWQLVPANNWKIGAFERIVQYGHLVGKNSIPYTPTSKHDFMHNKIMVSDDMTITGSYNFSRHAQRNAENILMIKSAPLAATYRDYIGSLAKRFVKEPKPSPASPKAQEAEKTPPAPDT
jgi:phosphatidylserine/phosphatidylglycerophosphate/cardiolipin synthase-like enzyme